MESRNLFCAKYGETIENIPESLVELGIAEQDSIFELNALFDTIRSGEERITVSLHLRTGPAEYQWFECNAAVVFDAEGKPDHICYNSNTVRNQRYLICARWMYKPNRAIGTASMRCMMEELYVPQKYI